MNLKDYTLTFPDEATWDALATELGWMTDGQWTPKDCDIVNIGLIYPAGSETPYAGWNVNIRMHNSLIPDQLALYVTVVPERQYGFAGGWFG